MKSVKLYYNPTAGEGENSKTDLIGHIQKAGYRFMNAVNKKEGITEIETDTDILAVAGGDGTVRKVCLELLLAPLKDNRPIGLLALGTANNIARALKIDSDVTRVIASWDRHKLKHFDVGRIDGDGSSRFFIESFGFGAFPKLIKKMKKRHAAETDTADKEFDVALKTMLEIVQTFKAVPCSVTIDNKDYTGNYIMAEIMNIRSLGPKLVLAPDADPGDGMFNVVLISERKREQLVRYLEKIISGVKARFPFKSIPGKNVEINWSSGKDMHIDDELFKKFEPRAHSIRLLDAVLGFLVSEGS